MLSLWCVFSSEGKSTINLCIKYSRISACLQCFSGLRITAPMAFCRNVLEQWLAMLFTYVCVSTLQKLLLYILHILVYNVLHTVYRTTGPPVFLCFFTVCISLSYIFAKINKYDLQSQLPIQTAWNMQGADMTDGRVKVLLDSQNVTEGRGLQTQHQAG